MTDSKKLLKKSIEILTDRAEDCFEAAQTQHTIADKQHANAEKLVVLGNHLKDDAIELADDLNAAEMATAIAAITAITPKAA